MDKNNNTRIIDLFDTQIEELFEIVNPLQKDSKEEMQKFKDEYKKSNSPEEFYFDFDNASLKVLKKEDFVKVLTNRNQYLINSEEQNILCSKKIGYIGMSVGGNIALSFAHSAIGMAEFRIADFDTLSTANLNRVGSNLFNVNRNKTDVMADEVRKINPYHNVEKFKDGINEGNMESFLEGLDLLVEECDDFPMKVKIRMEAKKRKIPVIMVANLADSIVLDVERFDIEDSMILHGKLSQEELEYLVSGNTKKEEIQKFAVSFVGRENVPPRAIESVMDIGKKLVGRPQLMATANIGAGFMNFVGREILLKKGIKSGRYILKFDTLFA